MGRRQKFSSTIAGVLAGSAIGAYAFTASIGGAHEPEPAPESTAAAPMLATHTSPNLLAPGEPTTLRYAVACPGADTCTPTGTLKIREVGGDAFAEVALQDAGDQALSADVPADLLDGDGFEYYVDLAVDTGAPPITLPDGGAAAPHRVWVTPMTAVHLPAHTFGRPAAPAEIVASAAWGDGAGEAGLERGQEMSTIGPSSFDVSQRGSVVLLDQLNDKLLEFDAGKFSRERPVKVDSSFGVLALGSDDSVHILDERGRNENVPVVRSYGPDGDLEGTQSINSLTADKVEVRGSDVFVREYPTQMWEPVADRNGRAVDGRARREGRRTDLPTADGRSVVVHGNDDRLRMALLSPRGKVQQAWEIRSDTTLGEVQLVEPRGAGAVAVECVYQEGAAEFLALRVDGSGLRQSVVMAHGEFAEAAALGRFKIAKDGVYQLMTAADGVSVVRHEMGA